MDTTSILLLIGKIAAAYKLAVEPIYKQYRLSKTSYEVLLYIGNHPGATASEICENRGLKANLVSMSVDKLVEIGYVERKQLSTDKRCVALCCTEKALPIIEQSSKVQRGFWEKVKSKLSAVEKNVVEKFVKLIESGNVKPLGDDKGENL